MWSSAILGGGGRGAGIQETGRVSGLKFYNLGALAALHGVSLPLQLCAFEWVQSISFC